MNVAGLKFGREPYKVGGCSRARHGPGRAAESGAGHTLHGHHTGWASPTPETALSFLQDFTKQKALLVEGWQQLPLQLNIQVWLALYSLINKANKKGKKAP